MTDLPVNQDHSRPLNGEADASGAPVEGSHAGVDLLADIPGGAETNWVVLQTRARCEKKISSICGTRGIAVYLPLRTQAHRYGGRERQFSSPLFRGYVFALADAKACRYLAQQRDVARVLKPEEPARLLHQLRQVRDALDTVDLPEVLPYIETGRTVRVNNGSLRGLEGVVQRWQGKTRVILNVEMIGQAVAMEIDPLHLDPVA